MFDEHPEVRSNRQLGIDGLRKQGRFVSIQVAVAPVDTRQQYVRLHFDGWFKLSRAVGCVTRVVNLHSVHLNDNPDRIWSKFTMICEDHIDPNSIQPDFPPFFK